MSSRIVVLCGCFLLLQLATTNRCEKFAGSPGRTEPSESGKAGFYQPGAGNAPPGGWTDF